MSAAAASSPAARDSRPASPFPWDEAMELGFGVLRLSSRAFWALTPRELFAASRALFGSGANAADRATLRRLMDAFPDVEGCEA